MARRETEIYDRIAVIMRSWMTWGRGRGRALTIVFELVINWELRFGVQIHVRVAPQFIALCISYR